MAVCGNCEYFVMQMLYVCVLCASCGSPHTEIVFVDEVYSFIVEWSIVRVDVEQQW